MRSARDALAKILADKWGKDVENFTEAEAWLKDADFLIDEMDKQGFVIYPVIRKPMAGRDHPQERRDQFERERKK